jgi:hypothetical protein
MGCCFMNSCTQVSGVGVNGPGAAASLAVISIRSCGLTLSNVSTCPASYLINVLPSHGPAAFCWTGLRVRLVLEKLSMRTEPISCLAVGEPDTASEGSHVVSPVARIRKKNSLMFKLLSNARLADLGNNGGGINDIAVQVGVPTTLIPQIGVRIQDSANI